MKCEITADSLQEIIERLQEIQADPDFIEWNNDAPCSMSFDDECGCEITKEYDNDGW